MKTFTLASLTDKADEILEVEPPYEIKLTVNEHITAQVIENLRKLKRLGLCTGDGVMAILGQAPIDPINLVGTLMQLQPDCWTFVAIDFSMIRILAQNKKKQVSAALRVDLMGSSISGLALNKAGHLTIFKTLNIEPSDNTLGEIEQLCTDTVEAAKRENV